MPRTSALACLLGFALGLSLVSCARSLPPSIDHPLVNQESPEFNETSLDDQSVSVFGTLSSHVTVIDFWASWCGSCMDTMPKLEQLWREKQDQGLLVVGVSVDDGPYEAARGAEAFGISFPIVHDGTHRLASSFRVYQVPTTFVVDRGGRIRYVGRDPLSIRLAVSALLDRDRE